MINKKIGAIDLKWCILADLANVLVKKKFTKCVSFRMMAMQK